MIDIMKHPTIPKEYSIYIHYSLGLNNYRELYYKELVLLQELCYDKLYIIKFSYLEMVGIWRWQIYGGKNMVAKVYGGKYIGGPWPEKISPN
jgi:hypothetical protein